jgi:sec-independent protein translocase protein TatA
MGLSPTHFIVLVVVAVLLFGGGRFSSMMTDVAKGVKDFKKSMVDEDKAPAHPVARLRSVPSEPMSARETADRSAT